jgi:hypothetical protein
MNEAALIARERELTEKVINRARAVTSRPGDPDLQRQLEWALRALDSHRVLIRRNRAAMRGSREATTYAQA